MPSDETTTRIYHMIEKPLPIQMFFNFGGDTWPAVLGNVVGSMRYDPSQ